MEKWIIFITIIIVIFAIIIIEPLLFTKKIIKKGKSEKAKIRKIELEKNMSADCDDPSIMRHWFNLEIEIKGKILKRQVAITEYTKKLKKDDCIDVLVYKNDFLLADELSNSKKKKAR